MEKYFLKNQEGVALVVAIIMLLVLTLIGISGVSTTIFETKITGNYKVYNAALYTAESGVEHFRRLATPSTTSSDFNDFTSIGDNTYRFKVDRMFTSTASGSTFFKVTSEGIAPNFPVAGKVTIEAIVEIPPTVVEESSEGGYN